MDLLKEVLLAEHRIRPYIRETPLEHSPALSAAIGANVFVKLENMQHTGSFKVRGAFNKLLCLTPQQRERGVIAASSGNHGLAVAYGMHVLGIPGKIVVPEDTVATKLAGIRAFGAEVVVHGNDCVISERYARAAAEAQGMAYLSPYNDPLVIGGQGTIAVEMARQAPEPLDCVLVAVGGGGMIAGIAGFLKAQPGAPQIVGCAPENSAVMVESVRAGEILEFESLPTLSDGTAGGIEADSITFEPCRTLVDGYVTVSEAEIAAAIRLFIDHHHMLIEGAAGVAVAACLQEPQRFHGRNLAIVICGGNIGIEQLRKIVA